MILLLLTIEKVECIRFDGTRVIGEDPNCPLKNKIQIAAYSYDQGRKPFEHQGELLKIFKTLVDVEQEYIYRLEYFENKTDFYLMTKDKKLLEHVVIQHTKCSGYKNGYVLGLYFGGQCPAPQSVTACYSDV